jgi:ABC-type dipeptide/oligopeptide/nickel transport system permease subunit
MLIVALLGAVIVYVVLGYIWVAMQPRMNSASPALEAARQYILGLPQESIMAMLKIGIFILGIYLVFDAILSATRRKKGRDKERQK